MSSLVRGSRAPGAIMTCLMLDQVRSRRSGWLARARQKLLTKSDFRVARMSSKTAWMRGVAETSGSVQSFIVGIVLVLSNAANEQDGEERYQYKGAQLEAHVGQGTN